MGKVMKARQRGENPQAEGQGSALQREEDGTEDQGHGKQRVFQVLHNGQKFKCGKIKA